MIEAYAEPAWRLVRVRTPRTHEVLTPDEARELARRFLAAAMEAEGRPSGDAGARDVLRPLAPQG